MNFLHVGPNCAILFCIEFLERCAQKIAEEIEKKKDHYFLIDCPGQVRSELCLFITVVSRSVLSTYIYFF